MSRYSDLILWTEERDLQEQARKEDLDQHLIIEYMREFNQIRNHKLKIT